MKSKLRKFVTRLEVEHRVNLYSKVERRWARILANEPRSVLSALENLENESAATFIRDRLLGSESLIFSSPESFRNHFFSSDYMGSTGLILDFGVRRGGSTLQIGEMLRTHQPDRKVYGFDSFLGIRDNWSKVDRPAGSMNLGGRPPAQLVGHNNIALEIGWVEDRLPPFLRTFTEAVDFVHLDFDVYSPTAFALRSLSSQLKTGSVIIFDDFFGFPGWKHHSARAFEENLASLDIECLGVSEKQAAFRLN